MNKFIKWFLNRKEARLFHPESPGIKLTVTRSWIGRLFKPRAFATLNETVKERITWRKRGEDGWLKY